MIQSGNYRIEFLKKAKEFVKQFDIDSENEKEMNLILNYFAGIDTKEAPLQKGLLIRGSIGSGKTLALKIIQQINKNFAINNIRDVVADFNINGFDGISDYVKRLNRVFDDIGAENLGKYYGNDTNVTQELILRRYELFQSKGLITHFTTNLGDNSAIMEAYGERAFDRLKEMCTLIVLGNNSKSRRNKYLPIEKKKIMKIEKTPEEIHAYMKAATIRRFNEYKQGVDTIHFSIYDFLDKNKIINITPEVKRKTMEIVKMDVERELRENTILTFSKYKELSERISNPTTLINRSKEINLKNYFDELIKKDIKIEGIFT